MTQPAKLIAFCGVDGVGKSSLVASLRDHPLLAGAAILKKTESWNVDALTSAFRRQHGDWRDWNDGPFAQATAIGAAMEFLRHEQTRIAPALASHPVVICDRHAICYAGYLESVGAPLDHGDFFAGVRKPDLLVLVEVTENLLQDRLHAEASWGRTKIPNCRRDCGRSTTGLPAHYAQRTVVVSNDGPFEKTRDTVLAAVCETLHEQPSSKTRKLPQSEVQNV